MRYVFTEKDYIAHYGMPRRSGRYPYGSGDRPYQDREGKSFFRMRAENRAVKKRVKKMQKQRKEIEKLKKEAEDAIEREKVLRERKQQALMSDPASKILKDYKGKLTNEELQRVATRLNLEKTLAQYSAAETKSALQRVNDMIKIGKTAVDASKVSIDMWNSMVSFYNVTAAGQKSPLPYLNPIPTGNQKQGGSDNKKK